MVTLKPGQFSLVRLPADSDLELTARIEVVSLSDLVTLHTFRIYDANADGFWDTPEIEQYFREQFHSLSPEIKEHLEKDNLLLKAFYQEYDQDGDEVISAHEFGSRVEELAEKARQKRLASKKSSSKDEL